MIYLILFTCSLVLMYFGYHIKNKIISSIIIFISLLLPCAIAGLRNISVGTDTKRYILGLYNIVYKSESLNDYINLAYGWKINDYLYLIITYIVTNIFKSFNVNLFVYECLMIFPLYFAIKKISKNDYKAIMFFFFFIYMYYYNNSLSLVRQSIAISFSLLSYSYYSNKKNMKDYIKAYLYLFIAIGFHNTAIIMVPVFMLYSIFNSNKINKRTKLVISILLVLLCVLFVIFFKQIITLITTIKIFSHYSIYLDVFSVLDLNFVTLAINISILIYIILHKKNYIEKNLNYDFAILISTLNLILGLLGTFIKFSDRIILYSLYILLMQYVATTIRLDMKRIKIKDLLILAIFFTSWIHLFLLNNVYDTLPYVLLN